MVKDYVKMAIEICKICGTEYENGDILFNKRLQNIKDKQTVIGYGLCPEHKKLHEDGFIALIAIDESKSTKSTNGNYLPENAHRTGSLAYIKGEVFNTIFKHDINIKAEMLYVTEEIIILLKEKL